MATPAEAHGRQEASLLSGYGLTTAHQAGAGAGDGEPPAAHGHADAIVLRETKRCPNCAHYPLHSRAWLRTTEDSPAYAPT